MTQVKHLQARQKLNREVFFHISLLLKLSRVSKDGFFRRGSLEKRRELSHYLHFFCQFYTLKCEFSMKKEGCQPPCNCPLDPTLAWTLYCAIHFCQSMHALIKLSIWFFFSTFSRYTRYNRLKC